MKKLIFTFFILNSIFLKQALFAQYSHADSLVNKAWRLLRVPQQYNPSLAFSLYQQAASQGHPKAMYELAQLYQKGLGTATDHQSAFNWFKKATEAGYEDAWGYLGLFYKNGEVEAQNFKQAYNCFAKGHVAGSGFCTYLLGFMIYKGLGCKQDYSAAVKLFKESSSKGNLYARYMLGLCYRNGYGVAANTDSARLLLVNAARLGNKFAKEELSLPEPEFKQTREPKAECMQKVPPGAQKLEIKLGEALKVEELSGNYSGYIIRYDWSGKHIIGCSKLELRLSNAGNSIAGEWLEDDTVATLVNARLTDSGLVFNNTTYERDEHYSPFKPVNFQFREARLQLAKNGSNMFISGNLQLYSLKLREPEKPIYISLTKTRLSEKSANTLANTEEAVNDQVLSKPQEFKVFPNPFSNTFNISFGQDKRFKTTLQIFSLAGELLFEKLWELDPGSYIKVLDVSHLMAGSYILKLNTGTMIKTTLVIKN